MLRRWTRWLLSLLLLALVAILALMVIFRSVDPPFTPVTAARTLMGEPVEQHWVPLARISPHLVRAVVASEDARFCQHNGVDPGELKAAIEDTLNGRPRGGSTITMQVVKNLFLWPSRSVVRKALEIPLALALDLVWSKRRIIEVYLNIAEWGPGIFGAQAAARSTLGISAARLGPAEAARLAVSLPNPLERDAGAPSRTVNRLAARLLVKMRAGIAVGCVR
ncbi:MAG: monofunctional biosynthetic peptidoglycan transglycosylase [Hyphomicrobiaceae bacterium]